MTVAKYPVTMDSVRGEDPPWKPNCAHCYDTYKCDTVLSGWCIICKDTRGCKACT